jgi:hypothetical protein
MTYGGFNLEIPPVEEIFVVANTSGTGPGVVGTNTSAVTPGILL